MVTQNKLPEFRGKALIEVPKYVPQADFLSGDFGKSVLEEYQERASQDYGNPSALKVLSFSDDVVTGSNSFAVVLMNKILRKEGLRTATQADLEQILRSGALNLRGQYEDSALVLRSEADPEQDLAGNLKAQLKQRLGKKSKLPVMVPYVGLDLVKDQDSRYGLAFKLREDAEIISAPILNSENGKFTAEDINVKTGLPKKLGKGDRTMYNRQTGLSGLNLDGDLGLNSDWGGDLANSDGNGRVVVVKGAEGTAQNLEAHAAKLETARKDQIQKINERYEKALKMLKGE